MRTPSKILNITVAILLSFSVSPLIAGDLDQLSRVELKDQWGQVLFCQFIYKMPEVKPRLYDFDTEQCNAAAQWIGNLASKYPLQEQRVLKLQAEKHASRLSYNASEPYHAVPACRQYCRKLAEMQESKNGAPNE